MSETITTVKVEEISPVTKQLAFDVPWNEVKRELDTFIKNVSKKAKIKGFRPGKAPRSIIESQYKEQAEKEVVYDLINKNYFDYIKEHGILAVTQPRIEQKGIERDKNFTFTATVEVEPVIEPHGYIGLNVSRAKIDVSEADIKNTLLKLRKSFGSLRDEDSDHRISQDDVVTISFQGTIDGKPLKSLKGEGVIIQINNHTTLPGFEENLMGMRVGETKEFNVTFPENYNQDELAAKEACFTVVVDKIQEQILPALDDEFIKNFEKYSSLSELTENIRKSLESENQERSDSDLRNSIVDELLKLNEFDVPPSLIERDAHARMEDQANMMIAQGFSKEKAINHVVKQYEKIKEISSRRVRLMFLLKAIAIKEAITVEDDEVYKFIEEMARQRRTDAALYKERIIKDNMLEAIRGQVAEDKIFKYIEEKANISIVLASKDNNV